MITFGDAVAALKEGKRVYREGWNGKGMWIELYRNSPHDFMTQDYIFMKDVFNRYVPWVASQTDILAEDWTVVP